MSAKILHLTDIHFGQAAMAGRWPSVRAQLFMDLKHIVGRAGPVDLVAVTGDIANRADDGEYDEASEFFADLALELLAESGTMPPFVFVPGNHDVARKVKRSATQRVLEELWDDETEREFFDDADSETRRFVSEIFAPYTDWLARTPIDTLSPDNQGILPGEFSATIDIGGMRVGIVGLNSTFRHLSDLARPDWLTLSPRQAQTACGGDLPSWSAALDIGLVLTHHPLSWIANATEISDALFNPATTVRAHLCGHLHEEKYLLGSPGTVESRYTHQGQSLFGLEQTGAGVSRLHGYAVIELSRDDQEVSLRIWPREATRLQGGTWHLDRKSTFGLRRGDEVSAAVVLRTDGAAPPVRTESVSATAIPLHDGSSRPVPRPQKSEGAKAALTSLLAAMGAGSLVAVMGDRWVPVFGKPELPFATFRSALWQHLSLGVEDDGIISTKHLMDMVRRSDASTLKRLTAEAFGYPEEEAVAEMRRAQSTPWAAFFYLSPLRDFEDARANSTSEPYVRFIDATSDNYRIFDSSSTTYARLASCVGPNGTVDLALAEPGSSSLAADSTEHQLWLQFMRRTVARLPTVYLADSVRSLDLWKLAVDRDGAASQYRPPSYVVTPELTPQFAASMERAEIQHIPMSVSQFLTEIVPSSRVEVAESKELLAHRASPGYPSIALTELKSNPGTGSRDYLLGASPTWADIMDGFAVELSDQRRLLTDIRDASPGDVIVVGGTAGAGRTTALMQCALALDSPLRRVAWIEAALSPRSLGGLVENVERINAAYVFVDDVDVFGAGAARFVERLRGAGANARTVVLGARSVRAHLIESVPNATRHVVGQLSDDDANHLVALLRRHNAIANRRLSDTQVRSLIFDNAQGQLLVGMIQATSGVPFADKIASECAQLKPLDFDVYASVALVASERESMTIDQIMEAVGGEPREAWASFKRLETSGLIRKVTGGYGYELRHRVVAEAVRSYALKVGILGVVVRGVLWSFAATAADLKDPSIPARRTMVRLLNHSYLIGLRLDTDAIRACYDSVEGLLADDFHYWLQRGAFEVERGDDKRAMHDLTSAMTSPGGDDHAKVVTEYAYLRLRLAMKVTNIEGMQMGVMAFEDLLRVIRAQGTESPHSYVVLAQQGVRWLAGAPLAESETKRLAIEAQKLLATGRNLVAINDEVARVLPRALASLADIAGEPDVH